MRAFLRTGRQIDALEGLGFLIPESYRYPQWRPGNGVVFMKQKCLVCGKLDAIKGSNECCGPACYYVLRESRRLQDQLVKDIGAGILLDALELMHSKSSTAHKRHASDELAKMFADGTTYKKVVDGQTWVFCKARPRVAKPGQAPLPPQKQEKNDVKKSKVDQVLEVLDSVGDVETLMKYGEVKKQRDELTKEVEDLTKYLAEKQAELDRVSSALVDLRLEVVKGIK